MRKGQLIPVCPEQLGGLPTPRKTCEIMGGTGLDVLQGRAKVINRDGEDLSNNFIRGAEETLFIAQKMGIKRAILQRRSPSCGVGKIYDGTFSSSLINGNGVTAALLLINGITVISDEFFKG
jgi:uncharacterized protein YbbK (DUF523 family)